VVGAWDGEGKLRRKDVYWRWGEAQRGERTTCCRAGREGRWQKRRKEETREEEEDIESRAGERR
jgi:hypothetical protein